MRGTAAGDLGHGAERREHGGGVRLARIETQDRLGDHGERALGADDQLGEVVARGRLHELAPGPDDLAGAEHGLEPEHLVARDPVFHRAHSARVGGDACRRRSRCARRGRPDRRARVAPRLRRARRRLTPGWTTAIWFATSISRIGAHLSKRDEDAALPGDARARQSRAGAARGHRHGELARNRDDLGDLGSGMGEDDHVRRVPVRDERLVVPVVLADIRARSGPSPVRGAP